MSNFHAYADVKDPASTRPYTFDWAPQLGDGVTLESVNAVMVSAAGCSFVGTASFSRVYVSGGTPGQECVFEMTVATSDGPEEIVWAFGIKIADAAVKPTEVDELRADLALIKQVIRNHVAGTSIKEAWRDGRRIIRESVSIKDLLALRDQYERDIEQAERVAAGKPARRAIPIRWGNT
jgi:hypothetical protein